VEFLGREDDQVKIRGFRVELGEIEAVLLRHPAVKHAAVVVKEATEGDRTVVAFVIAPTRPEANDLREYLRKYVPDYMVPSNFILVDTLPLNVNGKVDRRALSSTDISQAPAATAPPLVNPTEDKLLGIWRDVLGVNAIKSDDNFFDLGGHSLLAVQIIARIRNAFGIPVPLRCIFEAPTISGLSEIIAQYSSAAQEDEDVARILQEVEGLSEEEAQRLLKAEK
jgi:acyl carrier protein